MTQELVAGATASMLQQPPTGCDALRTGPGFGSVLLKPFPPSTGTWSWAGRAPEEVFAGPSRQRSVFPSHLGEGFHAAIDVLITVHG